VLPSVVQFRVYVLKDTLKLSCPERARHSYSPCEHLVRRPPEASICASASCCYLPVSTSAWPLIQTTIDEGNAPFGVDDFCPMTPRSVRASSVTSAGTSPGGRRRIAELLEIIGSRARNHRQILLGLADPIRRPALTFGDPVLTLAAPCSQSSGRAQIICHGGKCLIGF